MKRKIKGALDNRYRVLKSEKLWVFGSCYSSLNRHGVCEIFEGVERTVFGSTESESLYVRYSGSLYLLNSKDEFCELLKKYIIGEICINFLNVNICDEPETEEERAEFVKNVEVLPFIFEADDLHPY